MKRLSFILLSICVFITTALAQPAVSPKRQFRAGAATSNITPHLGVSINGNMQDGKATHIHDELHARCLALDDGQTKLVLVVCDSCMIPREIFDAAKKMVNEATGLPLENMMMSATHTHSAPTSGSVFQSDADAEYGKFLAQRIADGIRRALNNLEPARIGWASAEEPNQVFNRRWFLKNEALYKNPFGGVDKVKMNPPRASKDLIEPSGPIDPVVSIISLVSTNGKPIALYANYSLHYVGGTGGGHISADYYGAFCKRVKKLITAENPSPDFVALLSNGTSGNINNVNFREPAPKRAAYEQIGLVADAVAQASLTALKKIQYQDWVPLSVKQKELILDVRRPNAEEVTRAKEIMSRSRSLPRMDTMEEIYARETVQMADYPAEVKSILQAMRIGDLGITAIPCEVFVEIGLELREKSPAKQTFTVSLANGYNGYLPTVKHHELGGYETWRAKSSYLEVQAAPKITETLLDLLKQ
ncbi:MAG TPA: neutral/alkaline non-lysosomal ceramidase N-terminal domain-containing protein [Verrucomicrobiae bacterium]